MTPEAQIVRGYQAAAVIYLAGFLALLKVQAFSETGGYLPAILLLLGAVFMLVSGFGYALTARLTGRPPYSTGLAQAQFWLVTSGLLGSVAALSTPLPPILLPVAALLVAAGSYAFLFNLWRSLKASGRVPGR